MKEIISKIFGIDSRSLGLARIFLGFILLTDILSKLFYVREFFTDDGVVPRVPYVRDYMGRWAFSLHLASGELWFQVALISLGALFAFLFMIGYRWRFSAIASFVLLCSMQNRNIVILSGADDVMRLFLFWFMFMPSPGSFAVDRVESKPRRIAGITSAALLLQLLLIYVFTAIWKISPVYTEEYSAVYYSLNLDYFVKPLGVYLREYYGLTKVLTVATMVLESFGPILVLLPRWQVRLAITISFIVFHLGLFATLSLGTFSWIMMAYWVLFFPKQTWEFKPVAQLEALLNSIIEKLSRRIPSAAPVPDSSTLIPVSIRYKVTELISLTCLCLVVAFNASGVTEDPSLKIGESLEHVAYSVNINQKWWMFAPQPARNDGWFVIEGRYENGTVLDLLTGIAPTKNKPTYLADFYSSEEWQTYMLRLWQDSENVLVEPYAKYLCRRYSKDEAHAGASLQYIEIYFFEEFTPPMGKPFGPIKKHHIWSHVCF